MKVITEEWIKNSIVKAQQVSDAGAPGADALVVVLNAMLKHCQELDTLTVTQLRPMSEIEEGRVLVHRKGVDTLYGTYFLTGVLDVEGIYYRPEEFDGWIPMPRYEPEKV